MKRDWHENVRIELRRNRVHLHEKEGTPNSMHGSYECHNVTIIRDLHFITLKEIQTRPGRHVCRSFILLCL